MVETGSTTVDRMDNAGARRRTPVARALVGDLVQVFDFLLVIALSLLVAYVYHTFIRLSLYEVQYYAVAGIIGATGVTALLRRDGYYDFDQLLSSRSTMRAVLYRWALVILGLFAFGFSLKISQNFSRFWLFAWSAATIPAIVVSHSIAASILRRLSRDGGVFARRIAVVGATDLGEKFAERVCSPDAGVSVVGRYEAGVEKAEWRNGQVIDGDLNDVATAARNGEIDDIVVALPRASQEDMASVVRRLSTLPVSVAICPNVHWLDHTGGAVIDVNGASLLSLYRRPLEGWGGILKNIEDFALGSLLLVVLSPVMLIIAGIIKLQGKGPVIFSQQRHGFNHSVFRIYKFRTMTVTEDGEEIIQATHDDPRITPFGRFLRRYSLDELPQLFNVVRGEMSLVGPRPHALAHNHQYARLIENYSGRHKVKPGITGWAQVNGYRGETSENELMEARVRYDLAYVDNWSLWFDLKILILTIRAVVFPKNAV